MLGTRLVVGMFHMMNFTNQQSLEDNQDNKQASDGLIELQENTRQLLTTAQQHSISAYKEMLKRGMAKEQARSILPLTVYTKVWWTASFQKYYEFYRTTR